MEIKRDLKRQMRQPKVNVWKELLDFWPLSIVVPVYCYLYCGVHMPFSPVEKNWRSQREMIVLENGIEYYQVNEYKNRVIGIDTSLQNIEMRLIKFRDLRKEGNRKVLIFGCWKDFCALD